jgi:hypothetical protein
MRFLNFDIIADIHVEALSSGVIDLLYRDSKGWQVRGYKTDIAIEPVSYAEHLRTYSSALEALTCDVQGIGLVHVRPGVEKSS